MSASRWVVGLGALFVAAVALYVLLRVGHDGGPESVPELSQPALDQIDDASRAKMRDLLRQEGNEG